MFSVPVHQPIAFDTAIVKALDLAGVPGIALDGVNALPVRADQKPYIFDCGLGTRAQHPNRGGIYWRR